MSKLLFGILGFTLMLFFVADGVIIEDNTPSSMSPGSSANITITINKGSVEDFAKLEIELPEGMSATPIQTNGASFSFKDQKAKFIWMALPSEQEFEVSYKLSAASNASGNKIVKGTFSYIKSNQRVDYELQSKVIRIGEESMANNNEETNETTASTPSTSSNTASDLSAYGGNGMRCIRSIMGTSEQEYIVTLTVLENELENFAKIQENIPAGFVVSEEDSDGAVVTISDRGIKYVWFEAPQMESFSVSYRLTSSSAMSPNISGVFSYVENNAPKEVNVVKGPIESQDGLVAISEPEPLETTEAVSTPEASETVDSGDTKTAVPAVSTETAGEAMAENQVEEAAQSTSQESKPSKVEETLSADAEEEIKEVKRAVTSIPEPETGVSYRVQIAASHQVVGQNYFAKKHGFTRNVNIENHEGWVKYTTGAHNVYKSARDDRNQIRDNFSFRGPFVTAYNDGVRITVQEALMITKQQWYK